MIKQIAFLLLVFLILGAGANAVVPIINSVSFNPNSGLRGISQIITMTINADAVVYTQGVINGITVNGIAATNFINNGDNNYTVTYTVAEGNTDIAEDATIPISVELCDGLDCTTYTISPAAVNSPAIDAHKPVLNSVVIDSNNADATKAKVGNEITITFTVNETLNANPTATIATNAAAVTSTGVNSYTAKYRMQTADTEGIIPFTINFTDSAGNAGTQVTAITTGSDVVFDKTKPTAVADYNKGIWQTVDANVHFTCTDVAPGLCTAIVVNGTTYSQNDLWVKFSSDGNNAVSFYSKDNASNQGDTNTVYVLIDKTAPTTTASGISSGWSSSTASVTLNCSDSGSGCAGTTYRCDSDFGTGVTMDGWIVYSGAISFSSDGNWAIDFNSRDNVGNTEIVRQAIVLIDKSSPGKPSPSTSVSNNDVTINWGGVSDSYSGVDCYRVYRSENSDFSISDSGFTIVVSCTASTEVTGGSDLDNDIYYYRVRALDKVGNYNVSEIVSATVNYDSSINACTNDDSAPYLAWESPASNSTVGVLVNDTAIVRLKVYAYDYECGISFVKFLVDGKPIDTDRTAVNERYTVDWNSETVVDGNHVLKATAGSFNADDTENLTTKTITIKTSNGVTKVYLEEPSDGNKAAAQLVIGSAEDSKESADALVAELASFGALPGEESGALISSASVLLDEAQAFFNDGKYADAKKKANDAKAKFVQAVGMLAVEDYGGTSNYVFNEEHLDIMLKNLGFSQQLRDETKLLLQGNDVNRSLSFRKVNDGDKTYYKAVITLVVKNGSEEAMTVKVVEIVPKELAASASEIAGTEYTVLVDDPVLEWTVSLGAGEGKTIVYALKGELTAEEADDMIASGIINKFAAPPVLFKGTTNVEAMFLPALAGLFGLGGAVETVGVAIIIGAIIVFAVLYVAGRNRGRGNEGSALDAAASRAGFGSGFFGRLGGKEEPSKPKWGYKGI